MPNSIFEVLEQRLATGGVAFRITRHQAVFTSQEAAAVRGTSLASGAKALVCKADEQFVMIVVPADRKLASKRVRQSQGWKSLRFADAPEVEQLTNLRPGSIPPFGSLFGLPTYCDARLADNDEINFNAGDHTISISMRYADYNTIECPVVGTFAD
jgi:Ala-tRNA(Pro) deacylase